MLEKKLRKMFWKKQWEYFWLGFKKKGCSLADRLPLDAYEELEEELTDKEFYELAIIFEDYGEEKIWFAIFPSDVWIKRCCSDSKVFDTLSNSQLREILKYADDVLKLFLAINEERRYRMISLLDEEMLGNFMMHANKKDYITINHFLIWLCTKEENEEDATEKEKIADIFQKIANISNAVLMENVEGTVEKRILKQLDKTNRDVISIYRQVSGDMLYDVLSKSDFAILEYADREQYSWIYNSLSESAKVQFSVYLAEEKLDDIEFWGAEICAGVFALDYSESWKARFVKKVFSTRQTEEFNDFYEKLSLVEKQKIFEILLDDGEGKEIIRVFLKEKENLGFLEKLVKEKYVTC